LQKHIIFFNTKGGVCKSTLCQYSANELQRLGHSVSVGNTDQQKHIEMIENDDAEFCLYDTAGAFLKANVDLLKAASEVDPSEHKVFIIVPITTGKNDFKEFDFLIEKLGEYGALDHTRFVFTKTRRNSKAMRERKKILDANGVEPMRYVMPTLEDFGDELDTARTRNEISQFLHEFAL